MSGAKTTVDSGCSQDGNRWKEMELEMLFPTRIDYSLLVKVSSSQLHMSEMSTQGAGNTHQVLGDEHIKC